MGPERLASCWIDGTRFTLSPTTSHPRRAASECPLESPYQPRPSSAELIAAIVTFQTGDRTNRKVPIAIIIIPAHIGPLSVSSQHKDALLRWRTSIQTQENSVTARPACQNAPLTPAQPDPRHRQKNAMSRDAVGDCADRLAVHEWSA